MGFFVYNYSVKLHRTPAVSKIFDGIRDGIERWLKSDTINSKVFSMQKPTATAVKQAKNEAIL